MSTKTGTKESTKESTRQELLKAGMQVMIEKGYSNTGIQEVLDAVNVPKGSFYYYFSSKEDFALNIIDYFDHDYSEKVLMHLRDTSLSPIDRLRNYCETNRQMIESWQCRKGCLIGNLSQEMADQSESLRQKLVVVMTKWRDLFAACFEEAQLKGQLPSHLDAHELAELFLSAWEGAVLRAKSTKNSKPLDTFIKLVFNEIMVP